MTIQPVDEQLEDSNLGFGESNDFLLGFFEGSGKSGLEEGRVVDDRIEGHLEALCLGANHDLSDGGVGCSAEVSIVEDRGGSGGNDLRYTWVRLRLLLLVGGRHTGYREDIV